MKNVVYVLKIMLPLVLICAVTVGLLAAVNAFTAPRIAEHEKEELQKNLSELFAGENIDTPETLDDFEDKNVKTVYVIKKDGNVIGFCFDVTGSGAYKGKIEVLVAVNTDGTVRGIKNVKNSETPSIGGAKVLNNKEYVDGYTGKTLDDCDGVATVSNATKSSTALKNAVKNALTAFANLNYETGKGGEAK